MNKKVMDFVKEKGMFEAACQAYYLDLDKSDLINLLKEFAYAVYDQDNQICKKAEISMWDEIDID